jgi:hypothetical protein
MASLRFPRNEDVESLPSPLFRISGVHEPIEYAFQGLEGCVLACMLQKFDAEETSAPTADSPTDFDVIPFRALIIMVKFLSKKLDPRILRPPFRFKQVTAGSADA